MEQARQDICHFGRMFFQKNQMQYTGGNLSVRVGDLVCIKPSGIPWKRLKPEHMVVIDLEGNVVVPGGNKPSIEWPMHTQIYRNRPDITAIVHTHAPYAVTWSVKGHKTLEPIMPFFCCNKGAVNVAPYQPAGEESLGKVAVEAIGREKFACILQSHGIVACGANMADAVNLALVVEDGAKIACMATAMGGDTFYIDM